MNIAAEFVTSAVSEGGLPSDGLPEIALAGRSNVGKSSLINALTRSRIARTSAAPGKTRLANVYRVCRGDRLSDRPIYLVDLPGYGYARGGRDAVAAFEALTDEYFGRTATRGRRIAGLLVVDARHPGLASDARAWHWLGTVVDAAAIVATKIDKLARGQRIRARSALESAFQSTVLPVSAVTGEGLDELWKLIDRLASNPTRNRRSPDAPPLQPHRKSPPTK